MLIDKTTNAAIIEHIEKMSKYIDADLLDEYNAGIGFLYDIGFLSLAQYGDLYNKFNA